MAYRLITFQNKSNSSTLVKFMLAQERYLVNFTHVLVKQNRFYMESQKKQRSPAIVMHISV